MTNLTQTQLKEVLIYDATNGHFRWNPQLSVKGIPSGCRAGSVETRSGYRRIKIHGTSYAEHRLAWLYSYGDWPKGVIDHLDHNRSNNALCNLRDVSQAENMKNTKQVSGTITGHQGIWYNSKTNRYVAEITVAGKKVYQRVFRTCNQAIEAREAELIKHGFHENHGS